MDRGPVTVKLLAQEVNARPADCLKLSFVVFSCQKGDLIWCSALLMIQAFLW